uniref:Secreted protein n=1 Tax=Macrostomum lignano TaxID=282301 RepID=A0A1I8FEY9_9PLAT
AAQALCRHCLLRTQPGGLPDIQCPMHPRHKQQEKPRPPSPKWASSSGTFTKASTAVTGLLMTLLWAQLAAAASHLHRDRQPAAALVARQQPAAESEPSEIVASGADVPQPGNAVREGDLHRPAAPTASAPGASGRPSSACWPSTSIAVFVISRAATLVKRRRLQAKQFARPAASKQAAELVCGECGCSGLPGETRAELLRLSETGTD